jgi:hypothetical protein
MTVWEATIATRRTTSRLCTTLGVASLLAALVLALLPGSPASCGSALAPLYPPDAGIACASAQIAWLPFVVAAAALGVLLLGAGAALAPTRRTRRRR